ncbi:hypothetical protein A1F96_11506, partial [Pyrenophora tritici-repentis]
PARPRRKEPCETLQRQPLLSRQADPALRYPIAPMERLRNSSRRHIKWKLQRERRRLLEAQ